VSAADDANEQLHKHVGDDLDEIVDNWRQCLAQCPNVDPVQQWIHLRDLVFDEPDLFEMGHVLAMAIDRLARQSKGQRTQ